MEFVNYVVLSKQLAKAIDIANESLQKFPPNGWGPGQIEQTIAFHNQWKSKALEGKKISDLRQLIDMTFTWFQESGGQNVEYFWSKIKEANLPFKRENKMVKILKRKKINNVGEYNFVIDTMVPYLQEGFITQKDIEDLNLMIDEFEKK